MSLDKKKGMIAVHYLAYSDARKISFFSKTIPTWHSQFLHGLVNSLPSSMVSAKTTNMTEGSYFGVRVSVMFHFMFVHFTFSSVWVADWPPFGK